MKNLRIASRVLNALKNGYPVVALESTIISHGMPYPHNLNCALQVETILEKSGVVPATIAIINGVPHIGLSHAEIEKLSRPSSSFPVVKASRRDLSRIISGRLNGATTVSSTMILAQMAGIRLFVTGGIGGVHRFGEQTMDISADLTELGRTGVGVVCAGAKSILDIGKTLEYLETQGVPVVTLGSDKFPAFYTRDSGYKSPLQIDSTLEAARMCHSQFDQLKFDNGIVFACPIPKQHELDPDLINRVIEESVQKCINSGITGKETTPFILKNVGEATKGLSLSANMELVKNNARIGAEIAVEYAKIRSKSNNYLPATPSPASSNSNNNGPIFMGVAAVDLITKMKAPQSMENHSYLGTSSPATIGEYIGGVARNCVEAYQRLYYGNDYKNANTKFIGCGNATATTSHFSSLVLESFDQLGIRNPSLISSDTCNETPVYNAVLDEHGGLICAGAAMSISDDTETNNRIVDRLSETINTKTPFLVIDANFKSETIRKACELGSSFDIPVLFEPTSVPKSQRVNLCNGNVDVTSPNIDELLAMAEHLPPVEKYPNISNVAVIDSNCNETIITDKQVDISDFDKILKSLWTITRYTPTIILKLGSRGVLLCQNMVTSQFEQEIRENADDLAGTALPLLNNRSLWSWSNHVENKRDDLWLSIRHYLPNPEITREKIVNVTGAGDSLVGGFCAGYHNALSRYPQHVAEDSLVFSDNVWPLVSGKSKLYLLMNNTDSIKNRNILVDRIMLNARQAAECSLMHHNAVHPDIYNIIIK